MFRRFVAFTRFVSLVVGLFLLMGGFGCSNRNPASPTPIDAPAIVAPPGSYTSVPSDTIHLVSDSGEKIPIWVTLQAAFPELGSMISGGNGYSSCAPTSRTCFQHKTEICGDYGVVVDMYLAEAPGLKGLMVGSVAFARRCSVVDNMIYPLESGNGYRGTFASFPTGENCCRYLNFFGEAVGLPGEVPGSSKTLYGTASLSLGYKNKVS